METARFNDIIELMSMGPSETEIKNMNFSFKDLAASI